MLNAGSHTQNGVGVLRVSVTNSGRLGWCNSRNATYKLVSISWGPAYRLAARRWK